MPSASRKSDRISVKHFQRYARRIQTSPKVSSHSQEVILAVPDTGILKIVQSFSTADERR